MGIHRAEFHQVLLNRLPPRCRTFASKRLERYTQQPDAPIQLHFQDGSTATCDILIGADGLKSAVRKRMLQEAAAEVETQNWDAEAAELRCLIEPRFSGVFSYRALIPAERLSRIAPQHRVFSLPVQVCTCDTLSAPEYLGLSYSVPRQEQGRLTYQKLSVIFS
jgi:salicylate hydroxylase